MQKFEEHADRDEGRVEIGKQDLADLAKSEQALHGRSSRRQNLLSRGLCKDAAAKAWVHYQVYS